MADVPPPAHDDNDRFRADRDRFTPPGRPIDDEIELGGLDEGLDADTQPRRTIDDVDADLPPPPALRDLERGIDRLDEGLAAAPRRRARANVDTRARAAATTETRETREQREAAERARIREIVERVRARTPPVAIAPTGWQLALAVAGFLAMMTIGGAAAMLLWVDRVARVVSGIS